MRYSLLARISHRSAGTSERSCDRCDIRARRLSRATQAAPTRAGIAFGLAVAAFAAFQQFKLPVVLPVLLERYGYDRVIAGGFMSVFAISGLLL